jgi:hypothetical protein
MSDENAKVELPSGGEEHEKLNHEGGEMQQNEKMDVASTAFEELSQNFQKKEGGRTAKRRKSHKTGGKRHRKTHRKNHGKSNKRNRRGGKRGGSAKIHA